MFHVSSSILRIARYEDMPDFETCLWTGPAPPPDRRDPLLVAIISRVREG